MLNDDYTSPSLIGLDDKKSQLEALQVVREGATVQSKEFTAEDEGIDKN